MKFLKSNIVSGIDESFLCRFDLLLFDFVIKDYLIFQSPQLFRAVDKRLNRDLEIL